MSAKPEMSNDAVRAKTGKDWAGWLAILDAAGAKDWSHKEIVAHLKETTDLSGWWQQSVTVGYERLRGKRKAHETTQGFSANKSKTIDAPIESVFAFWVDGRKRKLWLDIKPIYSTKNENKGLRFAWPKTQERISVGFTAKAHDRTTVTIQHNKLPNEKAVAKTKAYWSERLDALASVLK